MLAAVGECCSANILRASGSGRLGYSPSHILVFSVEETGGQASRTQPKLCAQLSLPLNVSIKLHSCDLILVTRDSSPSRPASLSLSLSIIELLSQ